MAVDCHIRTTNLNQCLQLLYGRHRCYILVLKEDTINVQRLNVFVFENEVNQTLYCGMQYDTIDKIRSISM